MPSESAGTSPLGVDTAVGCCLAAAPARPHIDIHPQARCPTGTGAAHSAGSLTVVAPVAVLAGRRSLLSVVQHQRLPAKAAVPPPPMLVRVAGRRRGGIVRNMLHRCGAWFASVANTRRSPVQGHSCAPWLSAAAHPMAAPHAQTGPKVLVGSPQRPLNVPNAANLSIPAKVPAAGGGEPICFWFVGQKCQRVCQDTCAACWAKVAGWGNQQFMSTRLPPPCCHALTCGQTHGRGAAGTAPA